MGFTITHKVYKSGYTLVVPVFFQHQIEAVAHDLFMSEPLGSICVHKEGVQCFARQEHGPWNDVI